MSNNKRFTLVYDLFAKLVELDVEHREAALQSECAGDVELEKQVRALLVADAQMPDGKLTRAISAVKQGRARGAHEDLVGRTLGPYKLVSVLGRGGAGIVYLAERADRKFSARVAIKVVAETADDLLGARFAAEIQMLSTLNHPNIARLIDAGESSENFPYIVMEYVHGDLLDHYCDDKTLSIEQRLRLFLPICAAVQYAHQNLIVHRDLKPSNVLVTDEGAVKLLDFGIAKLLSAGASPPAVTRLNDRALTPEYASPEQIAGRMITTSSDVYSLGVLLYELLAGMPPYQLKTDIPLEMERAICFVDPPKPSTAVAKASHPEHKQHLVVQNAANVRRLSLTRLRDALAGDLDAIVLRALRKETEQRYASVAMLAADVERYLSKQAVIARQGNWTYYSGRFLRRHWIPVTAASITAVALVASAIVMLLLYQKTTVLYHNADIERDRAEQVSTLMSEAFSNAHPDEAQGNEVTALNLLDAASEKLGELSADPEVQARMRNQIGTAYLDLGRYKQAIEQLKKATDIERNVHADNKTLFGTTLVRLADAERSNGTFDAADGYYREAQRVLESTQEQTSAEYAHLLRQKGQLETIRGDLPAAERYYLKSIEINRTLKDQSTELVQALYELAELCLWTNDLQAAERNGREAVSIARSALAERHPDRMYAQAILGDVLAQRGNYDEAAALIAESITAQRVVYHNKGPQLAQSLNALASVRRSQGKASEAEQLLFESLTLVERSLGTNHYETGYQHVSLGQTLLYRHKLSEAEKHLRAALAIYAKTLSKYHLYIASAQYFLGETLLARHRLHEAVNAFNAALDILHAAKATAWMVARTESALGEALIEQGMVTQGDKYLRESYKVLLAERGSEDDATRLAYQRLNALIQRQPKQPK